MKAQWLFLTLSLGAWPLGAQAWEEQRVLEFVMVHNQVVRAHHTVTDEFTPPNGVMARMKEYTLAYGRAGVGGTDFLSGEDQPFVLHAGVQISIPLAGSKERREQATLKKLYLEKDHIRLQPANPEMEPLIFRHADVEVLGIVKVIVRKT